MMPILWHVAKRISGWLNAVNENSNSLFLTIGPGDFLVHHAIALGLHTTTLILVKGALDARGSKLMPATQNTFIAVSHKVVLVCQRLKKVPEHQIWKDIVFTLVYYSCISGSNRDRS